MAGQRGRNAGGKAGAKSVGGIEFPAGTIEEGGDRFVAIGSEISTKSLVERACSEGAATFPSQRRQQLRNERDQLLGCKRNRLGDPGEEFGVTRNRAQ
ncbi:MAG: hypothetical protein EOQ64_07880, partial [Mesorhizobium sp.]